jgi:hypothetical protein
VAARALPAERQKNLQLSTAPVWARVYVQDLHSPAISETQSQSAECSIPRKYRRASDTLGIDILSR